MKNNAISLEYLQSLSTADLLDLADEYGVDIPEQLNRSFVISELYEIADALKEDESDSEMEDTNSPVKTETSLPETYNETQIDFVLRTPVWAYVFWDISASDIQEVIESPSFAKLVLRSNFWEADHSKPADSFDLSISVEDRAQYILIPKDKNEFSIELIAEFSNKTQNRLASSRMIKLPKGTPDISLETLNAPLSPVMEISGMRELIKQQYESHRQSFS